MVEKLKFQPSAHLPAMVRRCLGVGKNMDDHVPSLLTVSVMD